MGGVSGTKEHFAVFAESAGNGGSAVSPQAKKRSWNAVARE
jgi:hypothetical protein